MIYIYIKIPWRYVVIQKVNNIFSQSVAQSMSLSAHFTMVDRFLAQLDGFAPSFILHLVGSCVFISGIALEMDVLSVIALH